MNIQLHIERLVLDGVPLEPGGQRGLQMAVEAELTKLLADGGLNPAFLSGGAVPHMPAPAIHLGRGNNPSQVGTQIAQAVYGGLKSPGVR